MCFKKNITEDIKIELKEEKLDHILKEDNLGFGNFFTDHMFTMQYDTNLGWNNPQIKPYAAINLYPSSMIFHYGQGVFEGLKCYRTNENKLVLFRPEKNLCRLNNSCKLLCIPEFDEKFILEALKKLLIIEKNWVPAIKGGSLYIRPTIIATEEALGVRPSKKYTFFIILTPVSSYYKEGPNPIKIKVEENHIRIAKKSLGEAKTIGNYAAGLYASKIANEEGYTQVLWLDSVYRKYVEEVGVMNVFFMINNQLITPPLSGSILAGVTRNSVIQLAKHWGIEVFEKNISIDEILNEHSKGNLQEAFGTGTAVVISPIKELKYGSNVIYIGNGEMGSFSKKLFETITNIQYGKSKNDMNWLVNVN